MNTVAQLRYTRDGNPIARPLATAHALAFLSTSLAAATAAFLPAATFHVDTVQGDDSHTGATKEQAWKSFHPVNRLRLVVGDRIEVSPGAFNHSLSVSGSGTADKPIEVRFAPGRYNFDPANARCEAYHISNTNSDPDGLNAVGLYLKAAKHVRIHDADVWIVWAWMCSARETAITPFIPPADLLSWGFAAPGKNAIFEHSN